jgi:hypothetical protein
MTVPIAPRPAAVIGLALSEAVDCQAARALAAPPAARQTRALAEARAATYRATAADLAAGRIVVLSSAAASHVAPDGTLSLALADLIMTLGALIDARAWRDYRAGAWCEDCLGLPPGDLCSEHSRDVELSDAYAALSRALGDGR